MSTVCYIFKKYNFNSVKKTITSDLNTAQKFAHLKWCRVYEHWMLDDWKQIIFSDEINVILNHWWEAVWDWWLSEQTFKLFMIYVWWKEAFEFIFWDCFFYDYKGSCHIWKVESAAEKTAVAKSIEKVNKPCKLTVKAEWKLLTIMH